MWSFLLFVWLPPLLLPFLPSCTVKKQPKDDGMKDVTSSITSTPSKRKEEQHVFFPFEEQAPSQLSKVIGETEKNQRYLDDLWADCTVAQREEILRLPEEEQKAWFDFRQSAPTLCKMNEEDEAMMNHPCNVVKGKKKSCETCNNYRKFVKDQRLGLNSKYRHLYGQEQRCHDEEMQEELDWRLLSWGEVFCPFESGSFKKLKPGKRAMPNQKKLTAIIKRYQEEIKADSRRYSNGYGWLHEADPVTYARQKRRELKQQARKEKQKRMEKGKKEAENWDWEKKEEQWQKEIDDHLDRLGMFVRDREQ